MAAESFQPIRVFKKRTTRGSGCGSVGRVVASDTRGLRFESSHQQKFIQTKRSELASLAHSVLREVDKMGYRVVG